MRRRRPGPTSSTSAPAQGTGCAGWVGPLRAIGWGGPRQESCHHGATVHRPRLSHLRADRTGIVDNDRVDLKWMRVLVELDRRGTLGAVAEATGYSKSAVSQQLAALQRAMGIQLAERIGRRLRLTPAGTALLPSAHQILASIEAAHGA